MENLSKCFELKAIVLWTGDEKKRNHFFQIPKAGGIKKGWNKYQLLNLQTKLLFYELTSDKDQKITWPQPAFIVDLTDNEFLVSSVNSSDAYHANKKDVSSIFKVRECQKTKLRQKRTNPLFL